MDFLEMMHADAMRDVARLLARRGTTTCNPRGLLGTLELLEHPGARP
jgi:hypothetical protein